MASSSIPLARYLFQRLRQLGVNAVHGVPGDYNLTLLDHVKPSGLQWVGNSNELNAGYAADGYARIKGLGALVTTFGVGELSAINAIAGAYAERAAVVHIVGTPDRASQDTRATIHHTFNDGEYRRFSQIHRHVTVAQADLRDPRTSPAQVDDVLRQCILHSRPVYIEIPVDMVSSPVLASGLEHNISLEEDAITPSQDDVVSKILDRMYSAKQPVILVDGETRAMGIVEDVQKFIQLTGWPTWTTGFGKGLVNETWPNVHGVYRGAYDDPKTRSFVEQADLVVCFGPHFSSTNSFAWTSIPKADTTIQFKDAQILMDDTCFRDIPAKPALYRLIEKFEHGRVVAPSEYPTPPVEEPASLSEITISDTEPIAHDKLWTIMSSFLRPGDIVLGETGTAGYGVRQMKLPPGARLFTPVTWLSIGYMLPAAQGAAIAQREMNAAADDDAGEGPRTILFIGDGSFQMTAQELGTIIHHNLNVIVFLLNNDGYTIERCIHGLNQSYNDVAPWRYLQAPHFFGAKQGSYTAAARTLGELQGILANPKLHSGKGLRMVEMFMDREDAPAGTLRTLLESQKQRLAAESNIE
ncbi:thiamine diphosphate-binding protein [Xylariales sp. PMI_506]|nr:thiamine diphosphate-binding protein [Xylariales sp. PMI_506]